MKNKDCTKPEGEFEKEATVTRLSDDELNQVAGGNFVPCKAPGATAQTNIVNDVAIKRTPMPDNLLPNQRRLFGAKDST